MQRVKDMLDEIIKEHKPIFDCTRTDWQYKGIYDAILDNDAVQKEEPAFNRVAKDYVAELMAIIWVDEKGIWTAKVRIKFPSGNKQVYTLHFGTECNETKVLMKLWEMPSKDKHWFPNKCGTGQGILKILQDKNMIDSIRVVGINQ